MEQTIIQEVNQFIIKEFSEQILNDMHLYVSDTHSQLHL